MPKPNRMTRTAYRGRHFTVCHSPHLFLIEYLQVSINQGLFLIGHAFQVFPFGQLSNRARIHTSGNAHP
jgi:hypothetical protein